MSTLGEQLLYLLDSKMFACESEGAYSSRPCLSGQCIRLLTVYIFRTMIAECGMLKVRFLFLVEGYIEVNSHIG